MGVVRGNWNQGWADPINLSLSKGQRRMAKACEAADEEAVADGAGEPIMFGDDASVAAE